MVGWWAAFFICGLLFPAGGRDAAIVGCATAVAMLGGFAGEGTAPRRPSDVRIRILFAAAIAGGIILWQTAGAARAAYDAAERGIPRGAHAFARPSPAPRRIESLSLPAARDFLCARLDDGRLSPLAREFVAALALGERSGMPALLRDDYSRLGIAHFLALSGLHLGVMAAPLAKGLGLIVRSRRLRHALLFALLSLYGSVACFPPSLVRALAAAGAAAVLRGAGLNGDLAGMLIVGSFAVAALDSAIVFEAGFQLSFAAVMGIAAFGLPAVKALESRIADGRFAHAIRALLYPGVISAAVQVFSMPLAIALFGRAPLLSPVANMLFALPFAALLYASAIYAFFPVGPVRDLLAPGINPLCRMLEAAPRAIVRLSQPHVAAGDANWILYGLAIGAAAMAVRSRHRARCSLAAIAAAIGALSFCVPAGGFGAGGSGDAAGSAVRSDAPPFLEGPGFLYVDRAGGVLFLGETFDRAASRDLEAALRRRGSRRIGRVVILAARLPGRHGLPLLARRMAVEEMYCSPYLQARSRTLIEDIAEDGAHVRVPAGRSRLEAPGFAAEITAPPFPPPRGTPLPAREAGLSCVLIAPAVDSSGEPKRLDPDRRPAERRP